ncbi:hypothetical protein ED733_000187 [Metarhizium rileyi]|uniref:BZIP domain-containing protein n=1 Tax=Metarhizium rileyi (strain RCEF 4871) TaxID=1649241 RepID=A0A5C6G9H7_METRR|nr:hypothetical protein ED733_000187 [Metarhizium rileyi]
MAIPDTYFDIGQGLDPTNAEFLPPCADGYAEVDLETSFPFFLAIVPGLLAETSQNLGGNGLNYDPNAPASQVRGRFPTVAAQQELTSDPTYGIVPIDVPLWAAQSSKSHQNSLGNNEAGSQSTRTVEQPKCKTGGSKRQHGQMSHVASPRKMSSKRRADTSAGIERNRVSAVEFRRKTKEWERSLENKKNLLQAKHHALTAEYTTLLRETLKLKNEVISHARCHDGRVDDWISREASAFVRRLSTTEHGLPHN